MTTPTDPPTDLARVKAECDRLRAENAALGAELSRLRDASGCRQRQCPTCRGEGTYSLPGNLGAKCPSCNDGYHWVFNDVFAAQLAEQRDAEIARLRAALATAADALHDAATLPDLGEASRAEKAARAALEGK